MMFPHIEPVNSIPTKNGPTNHIRSRISRVTVAQPLKKVTPLNVKFGAIGDHREKVGKVKRVKTYTMGHVRRTMTLKTS